MSIQVPAQTRPLAGLNREVISRAGAIGAATIFAAAGLVLVALGSAFPLALAVIEQRHLAVSPADLALAERIAPFWAAFVAAGAASFTAVFGILDRGALGKRIAIVVAGATASLAVAAEVVLVTSGADAVATSVATGVATIFAIALVASVVVQRRDA
jgi:hypothetical protein